MGNIALHAPRMADRLFHAWILGLLLSSPGVVASVLWRHSLLLSISLLGQDIHHGYGYGRLTYTAFHARLLRLLSAWVEPYYICRSICAGALYEGSWLRMGLAPKGWSLEV